MWKEEEVRFLKEYYKDYSIIEIAKELNKNINVVKEKVVELALISHNEKRCRDCNEIKLLSEFYKRKKDGYYNCYCKYCDNIRRRNNAILKKIKSKLDSDIDKITRNEKIKQATKNEILECTICKNKKLGKEFYYDSSKLRRMSICIECYKEYHLELEIRKIEKNGVV